MADPIDLDATHNLARRRRRWPDLVVGLCFLLVGSWFGLMFAPGDPLPEDALRRARAALHDARRASFGTDSADLERLIHLGSQLEHLAAEEAAVRWRAPRNREIEDRARELETAARAFAASLNRETTERSQGVLVRARALNERLRQIEEQTAGLAGSRSLRADLQNAHLDLQLARESARHGQVTAAETALLAAQGKLDDIDSRIDLRTERLRDPRWLDRWQRMVDTTITETRDGGVAVVVDKQARRTYLIRDGQVVARFPIELGRNGLVRKLWEGDAATPEGRYRITEKRDHGQTRFYRALLLDYPNAEDRRDHDLARRRGLIPAGRGPGGLIELHGHGGSGTDWTDGCVALSNRDMDALFPDVEVGTAVTIVPTAKVASIGAPDGD